jgi:drug/metabolite transporter (DMT)-like permease
LYRSQTLARVQARAEWRASEGTALGLLAVAAFGLTLPMTRVAVPVFGAMGVTSFRAAAAGVVAAALLVAQRAPLPSRAQWRELVVVALGVVAGFPVFAALSMGRAPAAHGAVVMAIVPLLTALVGSRLASERLPARFWAASIAGTVAIVVFSVRGMSAGLASADVLLVAAAVSAAVGYAYGGRLSRELGGARVIYWALVLCLPLSLPAAFVTLHGAAGAMVRARPALSMFYLALVSQLGGFVLWNRALAVGGIARTSQTQLLQPFVTLCAAAWLGGEAVHADVVVFAVFVAATVAVGRTRLRPAQDQATE